ncbi:ROK family protein [Leifsonia sp. YAF41]|uniref:ROK family protein n=1 Tax=Leifsonia sp. YAF41 TaxID=3233086 RepID=UPI003F996EDA
MASILGSLAAASREVQRAAVVQILRTERLSRSDLIARLQISSSLVTRLVRGLIDDGILRETGSVSSALGRPPVQLELVAEYGHVVAVSCEGDRIRVGVFDTHAVPVWVGIVELREQTLDIALIMSQIDSARENAGLADGRLLGIAVAVPGVVDAETGAVSQAPDLGWLVAVPLRSLLEETYAVPVTVDNDVNLLVIAERESGAAVGVDDVVYLYLGRRGVGAGIVSGGRLTQGGKGAAGEVGIIPLSAGDSSERPTRIEDRISVAAIQGALEASGLDVEPAPVPALVRWAESGNTEARAIRTAVLDALTQSILILSVILDPTVVLIGGAAADLTALDLAELGERLALRTPALPVIDFAQLGTEALISAAHEQCWQRILAGGI